MNNRAFRYFSLVSQFGVTMLTSVLLCGGLGYFIDKKLDIHLFIFILFPLGVLGGFSSIFHLIKKMKEMDAKIEPSEQNQSKSYHDAEAKVEKKLKQNNEDN